MNLLDAIEKHIDDQYAQAVDFYTRAGKTITREYFLSEDYQGESSPFDIAREVGMRVAKVMGELVRWDVFDNCREHGLMVTGAGGWTFCFYEHRNSDQIHIEGCSVDQVQSYGPYGSKDKYDTLFHAPWKSYEIIADALIAMLQATTEVNPRIIERPWLTAIARIATNFGDHQ